MTVVDPEGGLSPFSPSLPRGGEREGGQYAPPQPPLSLHPIWGSERGGVVKIKINKNKIIYFPFYMKYNIIHDK